MMLRASAIGQVKWYGLYYAVAYAPFAVILTFLPAWLIERGLAPAEVGGLAALAVAGRSVAIPLIGAFANRTGRQRFILLCCVAIVLASGVGYATLQSSVSIALCFVCATICGGAIYPLGDSIVVPRLKVLGVEFGSVRLWGSMSLVLLTLAAGMLIGSRGISFVPVLYISIHAVLWIVARLVLPACNAGADSSATSFYILIETLRQPWLWQLVSTAGVVEASHAMFYFFGTPTLLAAGHSPAIVGQLWSLGLSCEIVVFLLASRIPRGNVMLLVGAAAACAALRWGVYAAGQSLIHALLAQLLQGGSLALTQIGVARFMASKVPERFVTTAYSVYFSVAYGALNAAVAFAAGLMHDSFGARMFYFAAASCVASALLAAAFGMRPDTGIEAVEARHS